MQFANKRISDAISAFAAWALENGKTDEELIEIAESRDGCDGASKCLEQEDEWEAAEAWARKCLANAGSPDSLGPIWWEIRQPNGNPSYGFGIREDAEGVADAYTERDRLDVNVYAVSPVIDPGTVDELESGNVGFDLAEELSEIQAGEGL